jgi:hypothetical protein
VIHRLATALARRFAYNFHIARSFHSVIFAAVCLLVVCCVSRSVPEARFRDSLLLNAAVPNLVLRDAAHFTFLAVGDLHISNGDTTRLRNILQAASDEGDSFAVFLGDIVDSGNPADVKAFQEAVSDLGWDGKVFPVIGNHDIFNDGWEAYKNVNGPSHYSLTVGNSKFIAIDTADGGMGQLQEQWLLAELQKARPANLFLLSHYPAVTPGMRTYLKLADEAEAARLMHWATKYKVTAWLAAHYHSYLKGTIEGVDYLVAGGGGGRRMDPVRSYFFVQVAVNEASVSYRMVPVP